MTEKIRVLRIHNRLHLGGPIFNVTYLTKHLPCEHYETRLIIGPPLPDETSADFFLQSESVDYILLPEMKRSLDPLNDLKSFIELRKIIKDFKPDIVHTHTAKAGTLGRFAAWSCGVSITIHTFHGHVFHSYFNPIINYGIRLFERILAKFTTRIITISQLQKEEISLKYRVATPDKCSIIPLGFDLNRFENDIPIRRQNFRFTNDLKNDEIAVGIIGRFAPIKNHLLLFKAMALLKSENPDQFAQLVVFCIGDGELRNSFEKFLSDNQIQFSQKTKNFSGGGVVFTSWIKQIEHVLPGFDCVILTSDNEGTPLSLIEAQAAGVAVLSTQVGGVEDIIKPNKSGWLVPSGDTVALKNALLVMIEKKADLPAMGMEGKYWVKDKFTYHRLVADMDSLYRKLISEKKPLTLIQNEAKNRMPKVSVITVVKNRVKTIPETIKSIEAQTYSNLEYIIIDGGSTDGTLEFIANHSFVTTYRSEKDEGIYDAMNKGIALATGDIIGFLNSDDVYASEKVIELIVDNLIHTHADAAYGDLVYVDNNNPEKVLRFWKAGKYKHNSFRWGWMPPHPTFFVYKKFFQLYGNFNTTLKMGSDYELLLRFIYLNGLFLTYIPEILVKMQVGGISNSSMSNRLKANKEDRKAWQMNKVKPYFFTVLLKPFRKVPQWILRP